MAEWPAVASAFPLMTLDLHVHPLPSKGTARHAD